MLTFSEDTSRNGASAYHPRATQQTHSHSPLFHHRPAPAPDCLTPNLRRPRTSASTKTDSPISTKFDQRRTSAIQNLGGCVFSRPPAGSRPQELSSTPSTKLDNRTNCRVRHPFAPAESSLQTGIRTVSRTRPEESQNPGTAHTGQTRLRDPSARTPQATRPSLRLPYRCRTRHSTMLSLHRKAQGDDSKSPRAGPPIRSFKPVLQKRTIR